MNNLKYILLKIGIVLTFAAKGQAERKNIILSFNKIEYYADSTIKCVYNLKKGIKNGYAIEFDKTGEPVLIGEYSNGNKNGTWISSSGLSYYFKNGKEDDGLMPGCGTGLRKAKDDFQQKYLRLISVKGNKK